MWMLVAIGIRLLTASTSGKAVGKTLGVFKEAAMIEEAEQLVSVTVILSVTVTTETTPGFFGVEVEVLERDVWLVLMVAVEADETATETPVNWSRGRVQTGGRV